MTIYGWEEVRWFKDFSQISNLDDKERSDVKNPQNQYRKRSQFVGEWRNSTLNLGSLRSLRNVHVGICHRYFNIGFWHHMRTTIARDICKSSDTMMAQGMKMNDALRKQRDKRSELRITPIHNIWIPLHGSQEPGQLSDLGSLMLII